MKKAISLVLILILIISLSGCAGFESSDGPFDVIFDSQGGSAVDTMEIDALESFFPATVPTKTGYIFAGWFLDPNGLYPMAFNAGIVSDITLYAKWIEHEVLTEAEIRAIIDSILSEENLVIPDEQTITQIIEDLVSSGSIIDEAAIAQSVFENINVIEQFETQIITMLQDVKQSVVMIDCYNGSMLESGGSGVIYKKVGNTYYVLTNEHVVDGYSTGDFRITIFKSSGDVVIAKSNPILRGTSLDHDMAVITFTSAQAFRVIDFGNMNDIRVGQLVFAIGSPLDLPNTATMGMISMMNRPMTDEFGMDTTTIQHTAPINPGNSGGALVNIYGEMIGLNNMSYVDETVGEGIEGLHFAIQLDILIAMIPSLES